MLDRFRDIVNRDDSQLIKKCSYCLQLSITLSGNVEKNKSNETVKDHISLIKIIPNDSTKNQNSQ